MAEYVERHPQRIRVEDRRREIPGIQVRRHDRKVDELDAVARQLELALHALRQREQQTRTDVVAATGQDLPRCRHSTHIGVLLQAQHAQPASGQQRRGCESVVAGADDDHVEVGRHAH